jgi:hypothetical protein
MDMDGHEDLTEGNCRDLCVTSALTPAISPEERGKRSRVFEKLSAGFASQSFGQSGLRQSCTGSHCVCENIDESNSKNESRFHRNTREHRREPKVFADGFYPLKCSSSKS